MAARLRQDADGVPIFSKTRVMMQANEVSFGFSRARRRNRRNNDKSRTPILRLGRKVLFDFIFF
jgi:hypothetical protein